MLDSCRTRLKTIYANFHHGKISNFQNYYASVEYQICLGRGSRLCIKYASVDTKYASVAFLATEAYLIARPTFISRLLVLLGVILVPVLMAAVFGQFSEMRAPSPQGRTHPRFKKNPRLLALNHVA